MKSDKRDLSTTKTLNEVRGALQDALRRVRAKSIEDLEFPHDPLAVPTTPADLQIVASGQGLIGGAWGVQIFADETPAGCEVLLVALGDDAFTRIVKSGLRYSYSLGKSIQIRDTIASHLQ